MTNPNSKKLDEILSHTYLSKVGCKDCMFKSKLCDDCLMEARSAILKLVRELLPEQHDLSNRMILKFDYDQSIGFNQAIDLIESKLRDLE